MTAFVNNVTYNFEKDVELEEESDFLYIFHLFFQNLAYPLVFKRESDKGRKET